MNIVFIGNTLTGPGGEAADETHLVRELRDDGHVVYFVPRDEWREYVIEGGPRKKYKVPEGVDADIIIICKWHHFYDGSFIEYARDKYKAPVFYWVWDWMGGEDWHLKMARAADLYLSGELGAAQYYTMKGVKFYYFQFDVCDGQYPAMESNEKDIDVVFLGSVSNQNGRLTLLEEINKEVKIEVYSPDWDEFERNGFSAHPPVYGLEFNKIIARSKIILGTSANSECFGYWSNRIGKVLHAGGFLLQWYTPGMESIIGPACEYFSTAEEAIAKIRFFLAHPKEVEEVRRNNSLLNRGRWTSKYKIKQLSILMDRYLKDNKGAAWMLP